jgi:hypothetical protein
MELTSGPYFVHKMKSPHLKSVQIDVHSFAAVTMFAERGPYSGHVYQPTVNHRQMSFNSFYQSIDGKVPLVRSMVYPTDDKSFSLGNLMGLFCYELTTEEENATYCLECPTNLTFTTTVDGKEDLFLGMGSIKGYGAKALTPSCFNRLMSVFGLTRNVEADSAVLPEEVGFFLSYLCTIPLNSIENLRKFVADHSLDYLFEVTDDEQVEAQCRYLFALIRSLVPFRIAAYDGRHRFNLCSYFASGVFNPTGDLPCQSQEFDDAFGGWEDEDAPEFSACEMFKSQRFILTLANEDAPLDEVFSALISTGNLTTQNQQLKVDISWANTISEFVDFFLRSDCCKKLQMHELNFDSYWAKTTPAMPYASVLEVLLEFAGSPESTRVTLFLGQSKIPWEDLMKLLRDNAKLKPYLYLLGHKLDAKPPAKWPRSFSIFLTLLKFVCYHVDNVQEIRKYFQLEKWQVDQYPVSEAARQMFREIPFLRQYVLFITHDISEHCHQRYMMEKKILTVAASDKDDDGVLQQVLNENFPDMTAYVNARPEAFAVKNDKEKLSDENFGMRQHRTLTSKLQYSLNTTLLADVLKTINFYGFNPKIFMSPNANHAVHLYLK